MWVAGKKNQKEWGNMFSFFSSRKKIRLPRSWDINLYVWGRTSKKGPFLSAYVSTFENRKKIGILFFQIPWDLSTTLYTTKQPAPFCFFSIYFSNFNGFLKKKTTLSNDAIPKQLSCIETTAHLPISLQNCNLSLRCTLFAKSVLLFLRSIEISAWGNRAFGMNNIDSCSTSFRKRFWIARQNNQHRNNHVFRNPVVMNLSISHLGLIR